MSKEQSYQNAASELLRLVGGKENVISAAHCATRLRLVLKDESKADVDRACKRTVCHRRSVPDHHRKWYSR